MMRICAVSGEKFEITDQDERLYKKLEVPFPTLCPRERQRRKMAFRNERFLYRRACDKCGKDSISIYAPENPYTVYCNQCWWADSWDANDYAMDFDFNKPFFEQYDELMKKVPHYILCNFDSENSDYCNFAPHNKNSYMIFGGWFNEKCMYDNTLIQSIEINDSLFVNECQYGYELIDCEKCYETFYAQNCINCANSYFIYDCKNCKNCLFCHNLRNKEYHIFNKPVSKEEFEAAVKASLWSFEKMKKSYEEFRRIIREEAIHKFMDGENNENASGNFLYRCKNVADVFYGLEVEDVTHSTRTTKHQKDSVDISGCSGGELAYESLNCDFCHRIKFCVNGEHNSDVSYSFSCYQCENCFGCVGLRHKKYCIFNKQYTKEEYEALVPMIIEHMKQPRTSPGGVGEFFPVWLSPFAYNETVAQELYPLTREEALNLGYKWRDEENKNFAPGTESSAILSDSIQSQTEAVLATSLTCNECGKKYRVVKQEFEFYKKYGIPIPRSCFGCRHLVRLRCRAPYESFERSCTNCGSGIISSYSPARPEKVYCEACYAKAVL